MSQRSVPHRPALEGMWSDMLAHQLAVLPPLNDFWDALPEIFNWMMSGAPIPQLALIPRSIGEVPVRTRVLPVNIPLRSRSDLEIMRFAASNYLKPSSLSTEAFTPSQDGYLAGANALSGDSVHVGLPLSL